MPHPGRLVRSWWPVPAMLAAVIVVQVLWTRRYRPTGHAADHLSSATAVFGIVFAVGVIVWALPARVRRRPDLWLLIAVIVGGAVAVARGNVQVVEAIGADDWSTEQAEALGSLRSGFGPGHDLASVASRVVQLAVVALAGWLAWRKAVALGVAAGAVVLTALVPAWILPGAGLAVLAIGACVRRGSRPAAVT